jgi:hypothetical protein
MRTPSLDQVDPLETIKTLRRTVEAMPTPVFATLDGGSFDDLPERLETEEIACRSLFRDPAERDLKRAGPWLVEIKDDLVHGYVERLDARKHCAVYWSCPDGEAVLWRHLRMINEILMPLEMTPEEESDAKVTGHERVLFRHWDPNVLGAVLPALTRPQFARFMGPATAIAFAAPDYGGLKYAKDLDGRLPPRPSGPLRLESEQMERLKKAMLHASRLRVARFLKNHPPPPLSDVTDEFAWKTTLSSEPTADKLGILTERGRARWAYVMMLSDGKAAESSEIRQFILDGGDTPDNRVKSLIDYTVEALREQGEPS